MSNMKHCAKCSVNITCKNWSRHLKSKNHQESGPKVTLKTLWSMAKVYNLCGFSKWTKPQLANALL